MFCSNVQVARTHLFGTVHNLVKYWGHQEQCNPPRSHSVLKSHGLQRPPKTANIVLHSTCTRKSSCLSVMSCLDTSFGQCWERSPTVLFLKSTWAWQKLRLWVKCYHKKPTFIVFCSQKSCRWWTWPSESSFFIQEWSRRNGNYIRPINFKLT